MAVAYLVNPAFVVGEISPSLYGRYDTARLGVGATTARNAVVAYQGGLFSRAGTKFVGFSKQTGRPFPPRLIPFQFNINQGLVLEFGHEYMRVIQNGAFVTEAAFDILGASQSDPAVLTFASVTGALSATSIIGGVSASYAPGDRVTLDGGTYVDPSSPSPTILEVTTTRLKSVVVDTPGTGYAPADTITLSGGTAPTPAVVTIITTKVTAVPTIAVVGTGGTPGFATVTGTTGTGTPFQATVTIDGSGDLISVDTLTVSGSYTVNPTNPASEPVTGGGLVGAELTLTLGVESASITTPGTYTANSPSGAFSQASTSGAGAGAMFRNGVFAPRAVTVAQSGRYSAYPPNPVAQASTTGSGVGATFTVTSGAVAPFDDGDWIAIADVVGMIRLNGQTYVVRNPTATTVELYDVYGNPIDSTTYSAYLSGGTASRIYTLDTPYSEVDLKYLKFTQSNDVMSMCCVNQETETEYPPLDLARNGNANWEFLSVNAASTIDPPATLSGTASSSGQVNYQYVVTAVNPDDGTESVASPIANVVNSVNIAATAGTITLTWSAVSGVKQYNVYKATPATSANVPVGALFGFAGSAYGTQFIDTNIIADFTQVPPRHYDPFARGQVTGINVDSGGGGYTTIALTISSLTGSGAILTGVIVGSALSAVIVESPGKGYLPTDTVIITGNGAGATATLKVGPQTGTYPAVPAYFQQRRVYGYTLNQPNTYFMSQPGSYTNFDRRIPTIDTDAIIGNPWATQANGIQQMLQMPGGLVVLTGLAAWQLTGNGGSSFNPQPITPASQDAQPQAFNGCHDHVPTIKIDQDFLYVQAKGSLVRNSSYQYWQNMYTGVDLTLNSSHLFIRSHINEWAYAEEPYKVVWVIDHEGFQMLSMTYVKAQEIAGWTRHDTNGLWRSVCSIIEPFTSTDSLTDAVYLCVERFPGENTAYMIERMDERVWPTAEDAWCVDCGLRLPQPAPDATLTASSATGLGAISSVTLTAGGAGYSAAATARIVDDNGVGAGSGAILSLTIVGGAITAINVDSPGSGYSYPAVVISDPANSGVGASGTAVLDTSVTFTASASVFGTDAVGSVIRMGNGSALVTGFTSGTEVVGTLTTPITAVIPETQTPAPAEAGHWTITPQVSSVGGLDYLVGATVTGTYDGNVLPPTVVGDDGAVALPAPASAVTIGLGYSVQIQSTNLNPGGAMTMQGQRKAIEAVTIRVQGTRGGKVGTNQPDGAALSPPQLAPEWTNMVDIREKARVPYNSTVQPLYTGDVYVGTPGGFDTPGQIAIEQLEALPLTVLTLVPIVLSGDEPETDPRPGRQAG